MALIGLDIGTTGCKSTVFDVEGNMCSYAYKEYGIQNRGPGMFELDPDELWESVKYVLGMSVKKYTGEKITALSVSSFGESAVPVDKNGKVLHNSLLYTDTRGSLQCEQLVSRLGLQSIMEQTGVRAHPMYTINKIMWFKENMPDVYKSTWKFMLFEDFILFRLGHEAVIDYSLASRTMAFNVTKKTWAEHIIEAAGVDGEIFSRAAPSGTVVGTINRSIAEEIGLPYDTLLVTGGHDQVCAAMGGGIVEEGSAIDGIGTVECITPAFGRPIVNSKMMDNHFACVPHAKEGMYVTYAFNFTGGSLLKWYRDNFVAAEMQEAQKTGRSVYSILDGKAAGEPTDILILPHFAGAGTPYMDINAKGAIVGLSFDQTPGQLYRALLEGITYEMMYNLECLADAGVDINELKAVGGGARSDLWLQLKADIMGRKVVRLNVDEAGTLGTAILAGSATGVYKSIEDGVARLVKIKKEFYPDIRNHEKYRENYVKYKKMYGRVKEIINQ
jgi:xylulokinase